MKKKILFMVQHMGIGGVEKTLLSLLSVIDSNRYEIDLLLVDKQGDFLKHVPRNVNVIELDLSKDIKEEIKYGRKFVLKRLIRQKKISKAIWYLVTSSKFLLMYPQNKKRKEFAIKSSKIISIEKKYDIAIDYMGYMSFSTFYIAEKVIADVKATWIHSELDKSNTNLNPFKVYYEKFDHFFCVSQECEIDFKKSFPEYSNKTALFKNIISKCKIEEMANLGKGFNDEFDGLRILTVGRLSREKGHDLALKVLLKLINRGYNVKWYSLGIGPEYDNLRELIEQYGVSDRFMLLGADPNPYRYMQECDIYVQPSRYEGYSTTTNEARILAKPVITTNVSGAKDQFINEVTGLIVECDEVSIYNAVEKLIINKRLRDTFSENLKTVKVDTSNEVQKIYSLSKGDHSE